MNMNSLGNVIVKPVLRSPAHRLISKNVLLLSYTGQKSGKAYSLPVEYFQHQQTITVFSQKHHTWWRNFETHETPVTLRLRGKEVKGRAKAHIYDTEHTARALHKHYPTMSPEKVADLAPKTVVITIHLAYT